MKAYILKFTFVNLHIEVWRRVVMPAGATFKRLHETIQCVTNFQSIMEPYHYFNFKIENLFITNNEEILMGKQFHGLSVKEPSRIKIDKYLEKDSELYYCYDFGDDWEIKVVLEETIEDYYFGYPTLLEGEGMAPPEDVGGPSGYEEFLKIYYNPSHSEYLTIKNWAEQMRFNPLDFERVNEILKYIKYKKTEWEHIDHDNYYVLSDKYRGDRQRSKES